MNDSERRCPRAWLAVLRSGGCFGPARFRFPSGSEAVLDDDGVRLMHLYAFAGEVRLGDSLVPRSLALRLW